MFSKFVSSSYSGTGLGLYMCKILLKLMGVKYGLKIMKMAKGQLFTSRCHSQLINSLTMDGNKMNKRLDI